MLPAVTMMAGTPGKYFVAADNKVTDEMNLLSSELFVDTAQREPSHGKKDSEASLPIDPVASPTDDSCPEPGMLLNSPMNFPTPFLPL